MAASGTPESASAAAPRGSAALQYSSRQQRPYNGPYAGAHLDRIAFPLGGIGAGMICLDGAGSLSHVSLRHHMQAFHEPCTFAALSVKQPQGRVAKVLEGNVPSWKLFGRPGTGNGGGEHCYGFPRFADCSFEARFPFATIRLQDDEIPLEIALRGWSPFTPGDADRSSLPVCALEYEFTNTGAAPVEAVFSYNTRNFMATGGGGDAIRAFDNGFLLWQQPSPEAPHHEGGCAVFVDDGAAVVDHCWFRGGWFDSLTMAWENVQQGRIIANPAVDGPAPGATVAVPLTLPPGQQKTIRVMFAWYVPRSDLRTGASPPGVDPAFVGGPSRGTAANQQPVAGHQGAGLVNSFDPHGDGGVGTLTSPEFAINRKFLRLLIGGGNNPQTTCVNLLSGGQVKRTATGQNDERLRPVVWDLTDLLDQPARIQIVDQATGPWGHVNVDELVLTDDPDGAAASDRADVLLADFNGNDYGDWEIAGPAGEGNQPRHYAPWYAGRFDSIHEVAEYWRQQYRALRGQSAIFRDAFYDTTLPAEVIEAVAANLTILKSPTVMRQTDGRLWCWEGCSDNSGCCAGSCTHVWNYAQAICHLFPDLERSLRHTEFHESQSDAGHQTFRAALPIRPVEHGFHAAADGQLGGIMKVHREWRIAGDTAWLRSLWPQVKQSLDYCIATWDPRGRGVLEEPHHNTYDIEYWGPEGHCTSFYLGALAAACAMGAALDDDVARYRGLLSAGVARLEEHLYDGEYFIQQIQIEGLNAKFHPLPAADNGSGYGELVDRLNQQGPKYQYGAGCLSDGVLGFWMAQVCGVGQIVDQQKVRSNLRAIHKYNFKPDLSDHANPQRPTYAAGHEGGLLLCTWPKGGELSIPFVYSNEVWTGIEYQVASHLMIEGLIDEALQIVRACRDRYDGRVRNPFNEYECGHWYARAMSSYGLLQGLTGARFDAVTGELFIDSRLGADFRAFLATATGFGVVGLRGGAPFLEVRFGEIPVRATYVDGMEARLS
ncbi:MAG: hypothetical protein CMJ58_20765 [Planctomycetaceae bacterium]|nr:hypothetical protein [Planctomycetaceae bacterium]